MFFISLVFINLVNKSQIEHKAPTKANLLARFALAVHTNIPIGCGYSTYRTVLTYQHTIWWGIPMYHYGPLILVSCRISMYHPHRAVCCGTINLNSNPWHLNHGSAALSHLILQIGCMTKKSVFCWIDIILLKFASNVCYSSSWDI